MKNKIHLGKYLKNNEWNALREDINKRPIEGINGDATEDEILKKLEKYGIRSTLTSALASVEIWGSGKPMREFLWSEEMAEACVYVMENVNFSDLSTQPLSAATSLICHRG